MTGKKMTGKKNFLAMAKPTATAARIKVRGGAYRDMSMQLRAARKTAKVAAPQENQWVGGGGTQQLDGDVPCNPPRNQTDWDLAAAALKARVLLEENSLRVVTDAKCRAFRPAITDDYICDCVSETCHGSGEGKMEDNVLKLNGNELDVAPLMFDPELLQRYLDTQISKENASSDPRRRAANQLLSMRLGEKERAEGSAVANPRKQQVVNTFSVIPTPAAQKDMKLNSARWSHIPVEQRQPKASQYVSILGESCDVSHVLEETKMSVAGMTLHSAKAVAFVNLFPPGYMQTFVCNALIAAVIPTAERSHGRRGVEFEGRYTKTAKAALVHEFRNAVAMGGRLDTHAHTLFAVGGDGSQWMSTMPPKRGNKGPPGLRKLDPLPKNVMKGLKTMDPDAVKEAIKRTEKKLRNKSMKPKKKSGGPVDEMDEDLDDMDEDAEQAAGRTFVEEDQPTVGAGPDVEETRAANTVQPDAIADDSSVVEDIQSEDDDVYADLGDLGDSHYMDRDEGGDGGVEMEDRPHDDTAERWMWGVHSSLSRRRERTGAASVIQTNVGTIETVEESETMHVQSQGRLGVFIQGLNQHCRHMYITLQFTTRYLVASRLDPLSETGSFAENDRFRKIFLSQQIRIKVAYGRDECPTLEHINRQPIAFLVSTANHGCDGDAGGVNSSNETSAPRWTGSSMPMRKVGLVAHIFGRGIPISLAAKGNFFSNNERATFPTEVQSFGMMLRFKRLLLEFHDNPSLMCRVCRPMLAMFEQRNHIPSAKYMLDTQAAKPRPAKSSILASLIRGKFNRSSKADNSHLDPKAVVDYLKNENWPMATRMGAELSELLSAALRDTFYTGENMSDLIASPTRSFIDGGLICLGKDAPFAITKSILTMVYMLIGTEMSSSSEPWVPDYDAFFGLAPGPVASMMMGREASENHADWGKEWVPGSPLSVQTALSGVDCLDLKHVIHLAHTPSAAYDD